MKTFQRLRNKIILAVALYLMVIGVAGAMFLYTYLFGTVSAKAEQMDRMYLETVKSRLDRNFAELFSLAVLCANDPLVIRAVSRRDLSAKEKLRIALDVQDKLNAYIRVCPANVYINKFILSAGEDLFVQGQGRQEGEVSDRARLFAFPLYAEYAAAGNWVNGFGPSIGVHNQRDCYALIFPVRSYHNGGGGLIYVEARLDMVTDIFRDYPLLPGLAAREAAGGLFISPSAKLTDETAGFPRGQDLSGGMRYKQDGRSFRLDVLALKDAPLILYNRVDVTELRPDDRDVFYTVLIAAAGFILAAAGLTLTLSVTLTLPIQRLIGRIRKIGMNDFSYDPEIEKPRDEIGQIGKALNEMSGSIARLLAETEESFRRQKNAEIVLLQTKINPHFLYNTLDSIQWMAKIQKNAGIAGMTRSLISLLRNIAGGSDDIIPLEEELRLLEDYAAVMSVRFMGIFSMTISIDSSFNRYLVPKLTLQPLVENAIIHGIAPSGCFGTIVIEAALEGGFLALSVEDSGLGICEEKLKTILNLDAGKSGTSLNNIGVKNVHERLRLLYGGGAGLTFESAEGRFTRVTARLEARLNTEGGGNA
ncbi:MAG: histidine kinase [Spirochaetaceae bacterium]|jgi:two-component system sensor histidine kinase YesM|nr:histidine kinase [Spirochaetaceae bacterium]